MSERSLAPLFNPGSVAVVGASDDSRKWGHWLARGALKGASRRSVYLVNHRASEVLGRRAYRSLRELPEPPELVVIAVPNAALGGTVEDALAAGARAIVGITAADPQDARNAARDRTLAERVRAGGAVLLGPNCLGVLDSGALLELTSNPLPPGAIGLISQSGNLALELGRMAEEQGLGFSRFASLGNQADLRSAELVKAFCAHDATRVIALYIEDFHDGRAFARAAAGAVEAGKPVIVLPIERGAATARAVGSHTGSLASEGAVIEAACRAAGVHRVSTPTELIALAQALLRATAPRGRRVAVLADGGGHGGIAVAVAEAHGLEVPELSAATQAALRAQLPPTAGISNPVDLGGAGEQGLDSFPRTARELLGSDEVDAVLISGYFGGYVHYGEDMAAEEMAAALALGAAAAGAGRPIFAHTMHFSAPAAVLLRDSGVPVYPTIEQAVFALAGAVWGAEHDRGHVPSLPRGAPPIAAGAGYETAYALLNEGGVTFVEQRIVACAEEAVETARLIGYPVVLKAIGVLHKTDAGGVVLGIADEDELCEAYSELERRRLAGPFAVQAMAPVHVGIELIIGARWDPRFGPVALAGSGGIYAEVLRDTAVSLAPVSEAEAQRMIGSLRAAPLLSGARGRPPLALRAAASALAALSRIAAAHPELSEIEINPLLVTAEGALALDARLIATESTANQEPPDSAVRLHTQAA